ncbi:MAG: triose-phosphate isomerase [Candidatus Paceibacterota bacterium]
MKKKIIIGNWKMNPVTSKEAVRLFKEVLSSTSKIKKIEIAFCVPYIYLESLRKVSKRSVLGAQNVFSENSISRNGAYTGEVSIDMLNSLGVKYIILGHSERRELGENNIVINKKLKLIPNSITPILCVGEKDRDENHEYLNVIKSQVEECLSGINKNTLNNLVIAYEPVWAIGQDALRQATSLEFREISILIKKILTDKFGAKNISKIRIIYGGSVHPENAYDFLKEGDSQGFLVGRDSLNAKKFSEIIKITEDFI